MGAYLSEPCKEKTSENGGDSRFTFGSSSMQGWRISQEDAHNCIIDLEKELQLSFFAIYDGHGGAEVAQYTAQHFPKHIIDHKDLKSDTFDLNQILEDSFLSFDQRLKSPEVLRKLREMAGGSPKDEDKAEEEKEARLLRQEASMPLEQILAKYVQQRANDILEQKRKESGEVDDDEKEETATETNGHGVNGGQAEAEEETEEAESKPKPEMEEFGVKGAGKGGKGGKGKKTLLPRVPIEASPAIQAKPDGKAPKTESKLAKTDPSPLPLDMERQMMNGHSENENNENKEREQRTMSNGEEADTPGEGADGEARNSDEPSATSKLESSAESPKKKEDPKAEPESETKAEKGTEKDKETEKEEEKKTETKVEVGKTSPKKEGVVEPAADAVVEASTEKTCDKSSVEVAAAATEETADGPGGSSGPGSRRRKTAPRRVNIAEMNTEDDSDDSEEDLEKKMMADFQEKDSDDSDEDEDDDDEDEDQDDDEDDEDEENEDEDDDAYEYIKESGEEPGFDSGCTACVALIKANQLYVANVGDSRCVVSRAGQAVDMSFDHKPTDDVETQRILKAGGKVTEDGRVNGGLNLSRALGDHSYKTVTSLPDREQMISALPDVKSMVLTSEDEFMVIACDGIWNSMTSQEVIDFVKMRIDHEKDLSLSQINEELFDHCLAPHTMGDGTGCDNMTCIIVRFDAIPDNGKRVTDVDADSTPSGKRPKIEEVQS